MSIAVWKALQQIGPYTCGAYEAAKNIQDTETVRNLYIVDCKSRFMPLSPPAAIILTCRLTEDMAREISMRADCDRQENVSGELRDLMWVSIRMWIVRSVTKAFMTVCNASGGRGSGDA